jgi:YceI-like domain
MDVKTAGTRVVDGREAPPPGMWKIDPTHSELQFFVRHMMISKVRGRFRELEGTSSSPNARRTPSRRGDRGGEHRHQGLDSRRPPPLCRVLDVERCPEVRFTIAAVQPADIDRWQSPAT